MKRVWKLVWVLFALGFIWSCGDDESNPKVELAETRLIGSDLQLTRLAGDVQGLFNASGLDLPIEQVEYDVQIWEVQYETTYGDETVTASGMVFIPETDEELPFISYQHGTITDDASAPTNVPSNNGERLLLTGLAGTGYIIVAPDYVGFGSSADKVHPYYVEQPQRDAVLDLLVAAAELALENDIKISNHLYLVGYSEGGYATMAAHKGIEEQGIDFFDLQASFPSSGAYYLKGMRDYFFSLSTYSQPFFLAYVAESYRNYYSWDDDALGLIFQEPFATDIPFLFDGSLDGGEINSQLTTSIPDLMTSEVLENPDDPVFDLYNVRFDENSLTDWIPTIPLYMYHGDADITVPFENSVDVFDNFIEDGASTDIVTFTPLEGGTHFTGALPWLENIIIEIEALEGR